MAMAATDVAALAAAGIGGAAGTKPSNPAVRLAVAIVCFWLAGLLLFIAFGEGSDFVPSTWAKGQGLKTIRHAVSKMFQKGAEDQKGAAANA